VADQCMQIYAANVGSNVDAGNEQSVVVGISVRKPGTLDFVRVLVMGDAEGATQDHIMGRFVQAQIESSFLVLGHHGSNTNGTNSLGWLTAVSAQVYVASNKDNKGYVHPRREVIDQIFSDPHLKARLGTAKSHQITAGDRGQPDRFCNLQVTDTLYSTFNSDDLTIQSGGADWVISPGGSLPNAYSPCP
jgi:beta-lactamase superfamily II metal-dependent hydrolase